MATRKKRGPGRPKGSTNKPSAEKVIKQLEQAKLTLMKLETSDLNARQQMDINRLTANIRAQVSRLLD